MNVVASTSAHFGHSGLAVSAGYGPTLATADHGREGGLLAMRPACQPYLSDHFETIDE